MTEKRTDNISPWLKNIASGESLELTLWQEALNQLRQLHSDIWNGVMFFFTLNGIILASIFAIVGNGKIQWMHILLIVFLSIVGLILTVVGLRVFIRHREYYVDMLYRKTIIENELGFYDVVFGDQDIVFPWKVDKRYLSEVKDSPREWMKEHKFRKNTNSWLLRFVYIFIIGIYLLIISTAYIAFVVKFIILATHKIF